jgi:hypothetical protein
VILKLRSHLKAANTGTFVALLNNLTLYKRQNEEISKLAPNFDSATGTEGNGFRTFVKESIL